MLCADASRLLFSAVPVNVWDEEVELPQDLSVADVRHLPAALKATPERIPPLFRQVVRFDRKGRLVTMPTVRPSTTEVYARPRPLLYTLSVCTHTNPYILASCRANHREAWGRAMSALEGIFDK